MGLLGERPVGENGTLRETNLDQVAFILSSAFSVMLVASMLYGVRFPALCIPIGIATYGLKQIALSGGQFPVDMGYVFNTMIAVVIVITFVIACLRNQLGICKTEEGKILFVLVYTYMGLFWLSSLWSPFDSSFSQKDSSLRMLPYFIVYVLFLPALISKPLAMMRAFSIVWGLLLIGFISLLLSPAFHWGSEFVRSVLILQGDVSEYNANPLALADNAIYLMLTSVLIIIGRGVIFPGRRRFGLGILPFALIGVALGLWVAGTTGRGEFFAGTVSAILMLSVAMTRSFLKAAFWQVGFGTFVLIVFFIGYQYLEDSMVGSMPRYSLSLMESDTGYRVELARNALEVASDSTIGILFGAGARASEEIFGAYPHNAFAQAMAETGIVGVSLFAICYLIAFHFIFQTIRIAKKMRDRECILFACFMLALLVYGLIVANKKGSLAFNDTYMWLVLVAFAVDRVRVTLIQRYSGQFGGRSTTRLPFPSKDWRGRVELRA